MNTITTSRILGASLVLVVATSYAQDQRTDMTSFLRVLEIPRAAKAGVSKGQLGGPLHGNTIEIDSALRFSWDERGLMGAVAKKVSSSAKGRTRDLSVQIEALNASAQLLTEAQSRDLDLRIAAISAIRSDTKGQADEQTKEALAELQNFRQRAIQVLSGQKGPGSEYSKDLAAALASDPNDGFVALQEAATDIATEVLGDLQTKLDDAPAVQMFMSAHLITPYGKPMQIHLEGYDTLASGVPQSFARNRFVLDERTQSEIASAQSVLNLIRGFRTLKLSEKASEVQDSVRKAILKLRERLHVDRLTEECDKLVHSLRNSSETFVGPALTDVRTLQALLRPLGTSKIAEAPTEAAALVLFAQSLDGFSRHLTDFVRSSPSLVARLTKSISALASTTPGSVDKDAVSFFSQVNKDLVAQFGDLKTEMDSFTKALNDTSRSLLLTENFAIVTKNLTARNFDTDDSLDTNLDLTRINAVRRPGDRIVVKAQIKLAGSEGEKGRSVIEEGQETLYVEAYGGYWQSGGSLLFVEPKSKISRSLRYEPSIGLGFNYHYGIRGADAWNRNVNPGVGLTFSMLDFNDDKRFELGVALGLTLFNDNLWIGYGRNFTVGANYLYVGINPFALTRLLRGRR